MENNIPAYEDIIEQIKSLPKYPSFDERKRIMRNNLKAVGNNNAEISRITKSFDDEEKKIERANVMKKIMISNARIAFLLQYFPKIIDILNKYTGKSIGPKTSEKIYEEIKSISNENIYVSFTDQYGMGRMTIRTQNLPDSMIIYANNDGANCRFYDTNGKLNKLSYNMFDYNKSEKYIYDPNAYLDKKSAEIKQINTAVDNLKKLIDDYNTDLPSEFEHISTSVFSIKQYYIPGIKD